MGKRTLAGKPTRRPDRRRISDLPNWMHCPVVGSCLDARETRSLCKTAGHDPALLTAYEQHHAIVQACSDPRTGVPGRLDSLLKRKYRQEIAETRGMNTATLQAFWQSEQKGDRIANALWSVVSHALCSSTLLDLVYGDVHMLSHSGCERATNQQRRINRLIEERNRSDALSRELREALAQERANHAVHLRKTEAEIMAKTASQVDQLRSQLSVLKAENNRLSAQLDKSQRQVLRHQRARINQTPSSVHTPHKPRPDIEQAAALCMEERTTLPPSPRGVCGRCVLLLGGQTRQCRFMREAVEQHKGHFLHYDGGTETADARIDDLVSKADVVMCNTKMLSHSAMHRAKRLCQRQNKPIVFVRSASLSAFRRSLSDYCGESTE